MKKLYKLTVNGRKPIDMDEYYEVKQAVRVTFPFVTDCSTRIISNAEDGTTNFIDYSIVYTFLMPEHDVDVSVEYTNNMVNNHETPVGLMGMMGSMQECQMNNFGDPSIFDKDTYGNFCPECGVKKDKNKKYCPACEKRLKQK